MDDNDISLKKITPLASAIGAGLGAIHGTKNNSVLSSTAMGAGAGLLAGLLASALFTVESNEQTDVELAEHSDC
ncbi:hypothetical protein SAMN02745866_03047 [Alteromonadaceae bacterium Bs31]|nr:hypothetical protein SAMN02745866_03047 [Alteromonadaceae bacterium Bs31]